MSKSYRRPRLATKVAVSLPAELLEAVEQSRRSKGRSRSAIFQEALRAWLGQHQQAVLVREYEAGYRRTPEEPDEIAAAETAAVHLLSEEKW